MFLRRWPKCPECKHGALKTERDLERRYCDACHLIHHGGAKGLLTGDAQPFRTEADCYGEGIYDDD